MNNVEIQPPLVSIIVVTYNSSQFVLETLESAKAQTYQNIELIVTDDCSKDNTVEICRNWIVENKNRFVRTELNTFEKNTGISSNCNRGFHAAKGEWVKPIAGDDILVPNCIFKFMEQIRFHHNASFLCSDAEIFGDGDYTGKRETNRKWLDNSINRLKSKTTSKAQYREFKMKNMVCASSAIYKLSAFNSLGGFDEEIKLIEDYPFWIKATKNGYHVIYVNEKLVRYRVDDDSVQTSSSYPLAFELVLQKYIFKNILFSLMINSIDQLNINRKNKIICNILKYSSMPQRLIWKSRNIMAQF